MLTLLDTSYNDIRVTGDTTVHPVGIRTRSGRTTTQENHYTSVEPVTVCEAYNEGGERVEQHIHFCFNTALNSDPGEPKTLKETMKRDDWDLWKQAIISEINNFLS